MELGMFFEVYVITKTGGFDQITVLLYVSFKLPAFWV